MSHSSRDEEKLMRDVLEVEADDFDIIGEEAYVSVDQGKLIIVKEGLEKLGYDVKSAEIIMTPNSLQKIETSDKDKVLELMDLIDSHDDVNQVFSNFSVSE
jgi:transcriptional/translational regulatory protein YebC/TACO1